MKLMQTFRHGVLFLGIALFALALNQQVEAKEPKLNLSAWQHMPVLSEGRVMPLDTFARITVDAICNRARPTLEFDGQARKFEPSELLLSWITQPQRWEDVPFLLAEHDELRKDILDVPVTAPDGTHLKYVSPATVAQCKKLDELMLDISKKQAKAARSGEEAPLNNVEEKASKLYKAYSIYRQLTFDPRSEEMRHGQFLSVARDVIESWSKMGNELVIFKAKPELGESIDRIDSELSKIAQTAGSGYFSAEQVEPSVKVVIHSIQQLSDACTELNKTVFENKSPDAPGFDPQQIQTAKKRLGSLSAALRLLARRSKELHVALYDNGDSLRIIPALNATALDKDRDTTDDAQPWLTLQTVLYGSPDLLKDYDEREIKSVRATFARFASAYNNSTGADRPKLIADSEDEFVAAVRTLGVSASDARKDLVIQNPDKDLLAYTAYPPAEATNVEVRYHRADPFMWSWIISLVAFLLFCLAFGSVKKPMFWLGTLVLVIGLAWSVYGFTLRVLITRWAPVTNMYETVVFVPFFVSFLGGWFLLLPITWPGLKRAWKMTGIPGTWEVHSSADDTESPQDYLVNLIALLPRVALMIGLLILLAFKPYAAGGRTIINLWPVVDEGASLPNANNFVVWVVGLAVLLPTLWYLPRVILASVIGIFTIASSLMQQGSKLINDVYPRKPFGMAATFAALLGALVAWYAPLPGKNFSALQPVLRDNFWLTIHVLTIVCSYGAGLLAWGLGNLSLGHYLFGKYRDPQPSLSPKKLPAGYRPALRDEADPDDDLVPSKLAPAACHTLAGFTYKAVQVAVLLLAAGTILGGLWADVSWGRFWGWDPKEVWALISLLTYLAILHGRYAGWIGDFGMAMGSVLGATAIIFSWYGVNFVLGVGLHSYGFGAGGQWEVGLAVFFNWIFTIGAFIRYHIETRPKLPTLQESASPRSKETEQEAVLK